MKNNPFLNNRKMWGGYQTIRKGWATLVLISLSMFFACNSDPGAGSESAKTATHEAEGPEHTEADVQLNNGVKWHADSITTANVEALQHIMASNHPRSLRDYQQVGIQLIEGIDKMVKECRMTGADHEALHHWLEPLAEDVRQLKQAKSQEEAAGVYGKIQNRIDSYRNLFE